LGGLQGRLIISFGICGIVYLPFLWALERHAKNFSHISGGTKDRRLKNFTCIKIFYFQSLTLLAAA
jgi:hypothetical protein